jgi:hypothetical protein
VVLSALLLFCCGTTPTDTPRSSAAPVALEMANSPGNPAGESESAKPDAPLSKTGNSPDSAAELVSGTKAEASSSSIQPSLNSELNPAVAESYETSRQRKIWYGLMAAGHGGAGFDAWTTRRAIGGGYGVEADPVQRPFASSGAIYATTQVAPLIADYVGFRMMHSKHGWVRKAWWVPQATGASVSFGAAIHNYHIVP